MTLEINTPEATNYLERIRLPIPRDMYDGCGKMWVAISKGKIVGVRYMSDFRLNGSDVPAWVAEFWKMCNQSINCPWGYFTVPGRTKMARIIDEIRKRPDCPTRPSGKSLPRIELERRAEEIVEKAQREGFGKFRENCRNELAKLGHVVSGEASCTDFYPKNALNVAALLDLQA